MSPLLHIIGVLALAGACSAVVDWEEPEAGDPSIEQLINKNFAEQDSILQECVDRIADRLTTLLYDEYHLIQKEIDSTHPGILNNRMRQKVRTFTNDQWIIVDSTNHNLDVMIAESERRIEACLDPEALALQDVTAALKELEQLNWQWQNDVGRLLFKLNGRAEELAEGLSYELVDAYAEGGWDSVQELLLDKQQELLGIAAEGQEDIFQLRQADAARIRELKRVIVDACLG